MRIAWKSFFIIALSVFFLVNWVYSAREPSSYDMLGAYRAHISTSNDVCQKGRVSWGDQEEQCFNYALEDFQKTSCKESGPGYECTYIFTLSVKGPHSRGVNTMMSNRHGRGLFVRFKNEWIMMPQE